MTQACLHPNPGWTGAKSTYSPTPNPNPSATDMVGKHCILELYNCDPAKLDEAIMEMIDSPLPVLFDCLVDKKENCFPMIPSGKAHNEMILADAAQDIGSVIDSKGKALV